jgi:ribosomal protein S27AE
MMRRDEIDRAKILAALNTVCPSCGYSISPAEIVRIDFERMRCPKCGSVFAAVGARSS